MSRWLPALLLAVCAACTPLPPRESARLPSRWVASPNFDARRPVFVILHHTTNTSVEPALRTLTDPARAVSAHYLVERDGTLYQLVDERQRAWHAGSSRWGAQTDVNSASIGIELDNDGFEPYPAQQVATLLALLADLRERYGIARENVLAHGDVAPGRKVDPGANFPWPALAQAGFGMWCEAPALEDAIEDIDPLLGLAALGYDTANAPAAIAAFNRHFLQREDAPEMDAAARATLRCLLRQRIRP